MTAEETYLIELRLTRPELMESASPDEEQAFSAHFERLKRLLDEGRLVIAGPCLDGALGIVVFQAASEDEARRFMEEDPTIVAGLMTGALHPFRISLLGDAAPRRETGPVGEEAGRSS